MAGFAIIVSVVLLSMFSALVSASEPPSQCQSGSYYGDCNADFGTNGVTPSYVVAETSVTSTLVWSSNNHAMSIQYNPDAYDFYEHCLFGLNNCNYVQAGYVVNGQGCYSFVVQTYFDGVNGPFILYNYTSSWYCETFNAASSGVHVYIQENVGSNQFISSVQFTVQYFVGRTMVYSNTLTVNLLSSDSDYWYKSNQVIVGTSGEYANFAAGAGAFAYNSNVALYVNTISQTFTSETSNMIYGCMVQEGTSLYAQTFGQTEC